ncbi:hypothetical protein WJX74_008860 [Apatococcus lobatus]|uniref:DUF218 domain-containing protein n=1 Tax=Apatococcus lobatus TaxID=904363 RepID=A0AAW1QJM5_9CHLO
MVKLLVQVGIVGLVAVIAQLLLSSQGASAWQHQILSASRLVYWTDGTRGVMPLPVGHSVESGVVLGYRLRRDGTPSTTLEERVDMALDLLDEGRTRWLLFSGGLPRGQNVTEAEAMKAYALQQLGRKSAAGRLKLEDRSRSTRENALFSLQIAATDRWGSLAVITSPFHQLRAGLTFACAAKQSLAAEVRPQIFVYQESAKTNGRHPVRNLQARLLKALAATWDFHRELAALAYYWLRGWLC